MQLWRIEDRGTMAAFARPWESFEGETRYIPWFLCAVFEVNL